MCACDLFTPQVNSDWISSQLVTVFHATKLVKIGSCLSLILSSHFFFIPEQICFYEVTGLLFSQVVNENYDEIYLSMKLTSTSAEIFHLLKQSVWCIPHKAVSSMLDAPSHSHHGSSPDKWGVEAKILSLLSPSPGPLSLLAEQSFWVLLPPTFALLTSGLTYYLEMTMGLTQC